MHGGGVRSEWRRPLRSRVRRAAGVNYLGTGVGSFFRDHRLAHVPRHAGRVDRYRAHSGRVHGAPGRGLDGPPRARGGRLPLAHVHTRHGRDDAVPGQPQPRLCSSSSSCSPSGGSIAPSSPMRVPILGGEPLDPALLRLLFGVVVMLYVGHVYAIQCAKIVLPRDPGGRVPHPGQRGRNRGADRDLRRVGAGGQRRGRRGEAGGETGTALAPLARRLGPSIRVLGSLLVILLLGMSCLRTSTVLFNLVQERIPIRLRSVVRLPRRRGTLLFRPRRAAGAGRPSASPISAWPRATRTSAWMRSVTAWWSAPTLIVPETWDASAILERFGGRTPNASLLVDVLAARPDAVSVRIATTMSVELGADWSETGVHWPRWQLSTTRFAGTHDLDDEARRGQPRRGGGPPRRGNPPGSRDARSSGDRGSVRSVGSGDVCDTGCTWRPGRDGACRMTSGKPWTSGPAPGRHSAAPAGPPDAAGTRHGRERGRPLPPVSQPRVARVRPRGVAAADQGGIVRERPRIRRRDRQLADGGHLPGPASLREPAQGRLRARGRLPPVGDIRAWRSACTCCSSSTCSGTGSSSIAIRGPAAPRSCSASRCSE